MDDLPTVLEHYREKAKISRKELSRRAGLSEGYLTHIVNRDVRSNGRPYTPSRETVARLVEGLGLKFDSRESIHIFASGGFIPPDWEPILDPQLLRLNACLNRGPNEPIAYSSAREALQSIVELLERSKGEEAQAGRPV